MIANITSGEGVKGVIMYNEEKVTKGEGKLLSSNLITIEKGEQLDMRLTKGWKIKASTSSPYKKSLKRFKKRVLSYKLKSLHYVNF